MDTLGDGLGLGPKMVKPLRYSRQTEVARPWNR